jgi:4-amino-4-deoxy-L-arabinose transferase-like glycosyltransferase
MQTPISYPSLFICFVFAIGAYLYGVDSRFAPKNGDEYPYTHIVRMTSSSTHWLPLQSEMVGIKNTKPPLLFWQGMASTDQGKNWSLFDLRWPSLLYTALTAFLLTLVASKVTKNLSLGILAGLIWLAFFNTYRYGRPYLAEPPEIFWLSLPFFVLLLWGKQAFESKWIFPLMSGISLGAALLYKSIAYVVPTCLVLILWFWQWRSAHLMELIRKDLFKIFMVGMIAVAIFCLWFLLDPDPRAVWNEFILGENAGKFAARNSHYLKDFLWGGDSIGMLLLTSVANAGFLSLLVVNLFYLAIKHYKQTSFEQKLLWIWIAVFFLIFCFPSQRSGRYLLPIMPAIAILLAIHWQQLHRFVFWIALVLQATVLIALAWLSWNIDLWTYPVWHWILLSASIGVVGFGLFRISLTKSAALLACFMSYLVLTNSIMPLEGSSGRFSKETIQKLQGKTVWFPCDFRAKDEEYRLLIPGANIKGYPVSEAREIKKLAERYSLFAVQAPLQSKLELCADCVMLGERLEMRTRHNDKEIKAMFMGQVSDNLFVKEYIVSAPFNTGKDTALYQDACR